MSEIATRSLFASAQSKRAISEHAQKHAPHFSAGSVFDTTEFHSFKDKWSWNSEHQKPLALILTLTYILSMTVVFDTFP